jgi:hypothetical protein
MIIIKRYDDTENWTVYSNPLGPTKFLFLDDTAGAMNASASIWNNTAPTSTNFTVGANGGVNASGGSYVAYLFADEPGLIKCGSYTGNNSSTGPTIDCGFEPQWLMIKRTDAGNSWVMYDSARNPSNPRNIRLAANTADAENTSSNIGIDFISNGFQIVGDAASINANLGSYIYVAIAAPVVDTMTAEQFAEAKLKFATFENRSMVKCGNDAEAKRDVLIQQLASEGYSLTDILNYL